MPEKGLLSKHPMGSLQLNKDGQPHDEKINNSLIVAHTTKESLSVEPTEKEVPSDLPSSTHHPLERVESMLANKQHLSLSVETPLEKKCVLSALLKVVET